MKGLAYRSERTAIFWGAWSVSSNRSSYFYPNCGFYSPMLASNKKQLSDFLLRELALRSLIDILDRGTMSYGNRIRNEQSIAI